MHSYKTLETLSEGIFRGKNSKFHAYSKATYNEQEIQAFMDHVKSIHPKARHLPFAWKLGTDSNNYRYNDDGEPSGSAGKPIYSQIKSNSITNCMIIVARYFGGTKLGIPGLLNAFKSAAQIAIENNQIIEREIYLTVNVEFAFERYHRLMKFLKQKEIEIIQENFQQNCQMKLALGQSKIDTLVQYCQENEIRLVYE